MHNKVAVIIPVYNKEHFIGECIESVLVQTYRDIEIILVNDGSTDNSLEVLQTFEKKDNRIVVISQKNQGPNAARYQGVKMAQAEWITFIDADDIVDNDFIQTLVQYKEDTDLVLSNLKSERFGHVYNFIKPGVYEYRENSYLYNNLFYLQNTNNLTIHQCLHGSLLKKELLYKAFENIDLNIYFGEDSTLKYIYILECKRITIIDYNGYNYCKRRNSITQSAHLNFLVNMNQRYMCLRNVMMKKGCNDFLLREMERFTTFELMRAPRTMGMQDDFIIRYYIPNVRAIVGKRVVVYGAGEVGRNYIRQIIGQDIATLIACVDASFETGKKYMNVFIEDPQRLLNMEFDCILIAASNNDIFNSIKGDIIKLGIAEDKIINHTPLEVTELYKA